MLLVAQCSHCHRQVPKPQRPYRSIAKWKREERECEKDANVGCEGIDGQKLQASRRQHCAPLKKCATARLRLDRESAYIQHPGTSYGMLSVPTHRVGAADDESGTLRF